jgi:cytochrome c553
MGGPFRTRMVAARADRESGDFSVKDQFHLVHLGGREQGRTYCSDCHKAGFEGENLVVGFGSLASVVIRLALGPSPAFLQFPPRPSKGVAACVSCHSQHGEERNLNAGVRKVALN